MGIEVAGICWESGHAWCSQSRVYFGVAQQTEHHLLVIPAAKAPPRLHFSSLLETAFSLVGVQESPRIGWLQVPPRCAVRHLALPAGAACPCCTAAARDRAAAHATLRRLVLRLRLRLPRQHAVLLVVLQLFVNGGQRGVCSGRGTASAAGDERGARGTNDYDSLHMTWVLKSKQPCGKVGSAQGEGG